MRRRFALTIAALCVTASSALAQEPATPDESAIRSVVLGFKAALAAGDSTAAIGYLHPDLVVYEAGHAESLAEYRAGHLAADMEFAARVATQPVEQGLIVREDMALWVSEGESRGEFRGRQVESHGTETIVLISTDAGWKILHVHWSSAESGRDADRP
jgi:ketosteroid isomerase-like protein